MTIERVNGVDSVNTVPYLDITELREGSVYTKVALVTSASSGLTRANSGFAKFFIKDINSNVVCARMFDVKDFAFCGLQLSAFKNKPVQLKFVSQVYNGAISLIVNEIVAWSGEFDFDKFVGKMTYDDSLIVALQKKIFGPDYVLNPRYSTISIDTIGQGRTGAFMKVYEIAVASLTSYSDVDGIDFSSLLKTLFVSIDALYALKVNQNKFGVFDDTKTFDYLMQMNQKYHEDEIHPLLMDSVKAVTGIAKPKHLYSHIVKGAIDQAINNVNLVLTNNSLTVGSSVNVGGVWLSKY